MCKYRVHFRFRIRCWIENQSFGLLAVVVLLLSRLLICIVVVVVWLLFLFCETVYSCDSLERVCSVPFLSLDMMIIVVVVVVSQSPVMVRAEGTGWRISIVHTSSVQVVMVVAIDVVVVI
jgi:hypothetical protein